MLNFKYIKDRAAAGSWRRGYNYFKEGQVLDVVLEDNVVKGKVKGNFKDCYTTNIIFSKNEIKADCNCPLDEEWCKHAVSVALKAFQNKYYHQYLTQETGEEFEYLDENPPILTDLESIYKFYIHFNRRQKVFSVKVEDRDTKKTVNIERLLKAFISLKKQDGEFDFTDYQKFEISVIQLLYKNGKFDHKGCWYDIPFGKLDLFLEHFSKLEEIYDFKTKKRLQFMDEEWTLNMNVNFAKNGNVFSSLYWKRPDIEEEYPFEEVRYLSRYNKWGRYKTLVFPINVKLADVPQNLLKSSFVDIKDADGGKFVYETVPSLKKIMNVNVNEELEKLTLEQKPPFNIVTLSLNHHSLKASLEFEYDGIKVPFSRGTEETPYVTIKKNKKIYWVNRNAAHEKAAFQMLQSCKFSPMQTNNLSIDIDGGIDFYNFMMPKADLMWKFVEEVGVDRLKIAGSQLQICADIDFSSDNRDSFDIEIYCKIGRKTIPFEEILNYYQDGMKYFQFKSKGFVEIPASKILLLNKTLTSFDAIKKENKYTIKTFRAGLVAELIENTIEVNMSTKFEKFWKQITTFDTLEDVKLGKNVKADLREYQQKGLNWLWFLYSYGLNGILADDMGLGKTLQALALIQNAKDKDGEKPTLVICPTTIVFNWENEIEKFTPKLKVLNLTGSERKGNFKKIDDHDIVITSYALIRRDIKKFEKKDFRFVILDEAQNIKNYQSQTSKAVKQLKGIHKIALSGTPIENSLSELWSVFDFLMPDFLYDYDEFNYRYINPIMERQDKSVESRLKKQVYPFILRRMKRDVAKDLPDKVENIAYCEMTDDQRDFYLEVLDSTREEVFNSLAEGSLEKNRMSIFAALLRLRQICCHPALYDKENQKGVNESGKFEKLKEMLMEIITEGHRVLLFSQFVNMLDLTKEWFEKEGIKYEYLTGKTKNRQKAVDNFNNNDDIPVFLISLKAGGTGLNLTGADYVIHYDPWWNPAVEDQATDRAYRIGQQKKVFVYRLITKGSVEEKIQKLKMRKRDLFDSVISVDRAIGKSLTYDDLKDILSPD